MCIMYLEVDDNCVLVKIHKNMFFGALTLNISYKIHFVFGVVILGSRHPYEQNKLTFDCIRRGGRVHGIIGMAIWLIA